MGLSISKRAQYEQTPARSEPHAGATSASARRSASGPPPRVKEKFKELQKLGKSSNGQLNRYAATATKLARKNVQPGPEMSKLDFENMPTLIRVENARHPELNLSLYSTPGDFLRNLSMMPEGASRSIVRLANPDGASVFHHVIVDVRKENGQPPTLLVLEPVTLNMATFTPQLAFWADMRRHGIDTSRVAVVEAGAQTSPNGCIMYCLNYALKALKNRAAFDGMHRNLAQQRGPGHELGLERHIAQSSGVLTNFSPQDIRGFLGNIAFAAGPLVLPPDFYKHMNSATLAKTVSEIAAQHCVPGERPATARVNSARHPVPESLEQRVAAFTVTRPNQNGDMRTYSASIEGFRLQEIARAKKELP